MLVSKQVLLIKTEATPVDGLVTLILEKSEY